MADVIRLRCLRCDKTYDVPAEDMSIIGYTKYSYCEECLREGVRLLSAKDEAEELRQPFYVLDTPMGQMQVHHGRIMAFKKRTVAEQQLRETESLLRKNGFEAWCGYIFIRPLTLESCGMKKHEFRWMDTTISEEEEEGEQDG